MAPTGALILLALGLAPSSASAAEPSSHGDWRMLGHRYEAVYAWNNSTVRPSIRTADVTFLTVWRVRQGEADFETQEIRFDCLAKTHRIRERAAFRMDGSTVPSTPPTDHDLSFEPNSALGILFAMACGTRERPAQATPSSLRDYAEAARVHLVSGAADWQADGR